MRILVVSTYFDTHRGGLEIVAGQLARRFWRAGHRVTWMACDASAAPHTGTCDRSVPLRAFNGSERALGLPFPLPSPAALRAIAREVEAADIVLLHDAVYPTNVATYLAARWQKKPVMITQHIGCVPYRNPLSRILMQLLTRLVTRPILAGADQVVFISRITQRAFADVRFRRAPLLVFNGIDTETFRPAADSAEKAAARRKLGLSPDRPLALFVGRFVEKKGLHILRHAAAIGQDIDWALAGWGHLNPHQWRLPNIRVFSGLSQGSLAPLYRASDVFVLPSVGEGFPLVLQEALACGIPAVCATETAEADDRLRALVKTITVEERDSAIAARELVHAARAAIAADSAEQAARRSQYMRTWYSWEHAAELYLRHMGDLSGHKDAVADGVHPLPAAGAGP